MILGFLVGDFIFFQSMLRLYILMFHTPKLGIAPCYTRSFGGTRVQANTLLSEGGMWPCVKSRNNAEGHFYTSAAISELCDPGPGRSTADVTTPHWTTGRQQMQTAQSRVPDLG